MRKLSNFLLTRGTIRSTWASRDHVILFFDCAINNAYLLYKHNCKVFTKELRTFRFRTELLIHRSRHRKRCVVPQSLRHSRDAAPSGCSLRRVREVGLTRGKCRHCMDIGRHPVHHTTFACSFCRVRLCKIPCYDDYHKD